MIMDTRTLFLLILFGMILALSSNIQAQDFTAMPDDVFIQYIRTSRAQRSSVGDRTTAIHDEKCGFGLTAEVARRMPSMNSLLRADLKKALAQQSLDTNVVSPSGRFKIHFDTTGRNVAALLNSGGIPIPYTYFEYARNVADFFDYAYEKEVTQLGYLPPPFEGGQTSYNIYLIDFGTSPYGQTSIIEQWPSSNARPTYTTYIEMDNDFNGFHTSGLDGARVTAAHEFHHMVQLGSYGFWSGDRFMYEMTSTYYENFVYPAIPDYFQYLPSFFNRPERSLFAWDGYETAHFFKMLEKRYEPGVIRMFWEQMKKIDPLTGMDAVLQAPQFQSDLATEYCTFAFWNFFTAYRSTEQPMECYDVAEMYPKIKVAATTNFIDEHISFTGSLPPLAAQYFVAYRGSDSAAFIVSNTNLNAAIQKLPTPSSFTIEVMTGGFGSDYQQVGNGWGYKFSSNVTNTLCMKVYAKDAVVEPPVVGAFPNPYDPRYDGLIRFPIGKSVSQTKANVSIYSAGMHLAFRSEKLEIRSDPSFGRYVSWNGHLGNGSEAPSGVYFYVINYGEKTIKGKFAVVKP